MAVASSCSYQLGKPSGIVDGSYGVKIESRKVECPLAGVLNECGKKHGHL